MNIYRPYSINIWRFTVRGQPRSKTAVRRASIYVPCSYKKPVEQHLVNGMRRQAQIYLNQLFHLKFLMSTYSFSLFDKMCLRRISLWPVWLRNTVSLMLLLVGLSHQDRDLSPPPSNSNQQCFKRMSFLWWTLSTPDSLWFGAAYCRGVETHWGGSFAFHNGSGGNGVCWGRRGFAGGQRGDRWRFSASSDPILVVLLLFHFESVAKVLLESKVWGKRLNWIFKKTSQWRSG